MKKALITGITGQDGSYLAELLLEKGYEVHGIIRRSSSFNTGRIMHIFEDVHNPDPKLKLHYGDLTDGSRISKLIEEIEPTEVYNLGAQSHVRISFDEPVYTAQTVGMGALRMLEAIRNVNPEIKLYQASSSEMFGDNPNVPFNEESVLMPASPYACSKVFANNLVNQKKPGKIVNISSIAAEIVLGNYLSSYCASKAAVSHLTRTMAFEYAKYNIQVNAIAPGYILTDLNKNFFETDEGKEMIKTIPQKRLGKPEELDGALLLLCSELGSFMTGSIIRVDGGHVIG